MLIAAHHIALLLLSTAAPGSREHQEIIQQNGQGVWVALSELNLVAQAIGDSLWCLTERGRVFVDHILSLPLPEMAWRMPGIVPEGGRTAFGSVLDRILSLPNGAPIPEAGEGVAPPPPPPPTRLTRRQIPTDPAELRAEALRMLDSGCGMNETAELLKLSPDQVQAIFYGGS